MTVSWGDNTPNSAGTVQADPHGGFDVYGAHTYAAIGSDTITVTVADDSGQTVTLTGSATVSAAATSITATAKKKATQLVKTARLNRARQPHLCGRDARQRSRAT